MYNEFSRMKKTIAAFLGLGLLVSTIGVASFSAVKNNENEVVEVEASKSSYWDSWISTNRSTIASGGKAFVNIN